MPSKPKWWGILSLCVLGLLAIAAVLIYRHFENKAVNSRLRLDDAKLNYVLLLRDYLKGGQNPESQSSASVFISASTINSVLSAANSVTLTLPNSGNTSVLIRKVEAHFSDGFPQIDATVQVTRPNPALTVDAVLSAVLEPRLEKPDSNVLQFYVHPLSISLAPSDQVISREASQIASDVLSKLAIAYSDRLPHFTVPLSRSFSVAFPETTVPLPVPTQAGKLNGELDLPGLSFQTGLSLSGLVFLSDGIHIFVSATTGDSNKRAAAVLLPFSNSTKAIPPRSSNDVATLVKSEESQIAAIQTEIGNLATALMVKNSEFRIWASSGLLSEVTGVFNSLTPDQRRIHFHTLSEEGQIYRLGGGGPGCGGYAELVGGNSTSADVQIGNLATSWKPGQGFMGSADLQFAFSAQVTGHVNGPAGPHPTWVLNCVHIPWRINKDACTNLPSVTVSCETPVGGGVGLGSYGIHGDRTERLSAAITLRSDTSNWLVYDLSAVAPDQVPITISVGLGQLGELGLPFTFNVPHQVLVSGKAPPILNQAGVIELPEEHFTKKYSISVVPVAGNVGADGYAVSGTVKVNWQ